jgi:hypothetical protein
MEIMIAKFNINNIVANVKKIYKWQKDLDPMKPYFKNFECEIFQTPDKIYTDGVLYVINDQTIEIT